MSPATEAEIETKPISEILSAPRVASVDTFRGLTILLMVFVNDLGDSAPGWLRHIQPPDADGMTLADLVFPWFLFIVGVSIALALERACSLQTSWWKQVGHILVRTASLLFMGVVVMNGMDHGPDHPSTLETLASASIVLAWCSLPEKGWRIWVGLKVLGILGLIAFFILFRTQPAPVELPFWGQVEGWRWLRTGWWGILGLIGWAYLTTASLALIFGKRREWLMGALALTMTLHLALGHDGLFARIHQKPWLRTALPALEALQRVVDSTEKFVNLRETTGSLAAIALAGCLLGSILRRDSDVTTPGSRLRWTAIFALGLALAGLLTDTFEGINKNAATPAWCFFSASLACVVWMILYLLIDVAGFRKWTVLIRPAGANPLVAYFLHPVTLGVVTLVGMGGKVLAYQDSPDWRVTVGGSFAMACFVCALTGLLGRLGLRVKL